MIMVVCVSITEEDSILDTVSAKYPELVSWNYAHLS